MSRISGIYSLCDQDISASWADRLSQKASEWPAGVSGSRKITSGFGLARKLENRSVEGDREQVPFFQCGVLVLLDGRLDNRAELASRLQLNAANASDDRIICAAYRKWGAEFASQLIGDFAIALIDEQLQRVVLARDYAGARPLFYAATAGFIGFASTMDAVLSLPFVAAKPNSVWIADFLESIKPDAHSTPYRDVFAAAPGTVLVLDGDGQKELRFWEPPHVDEVQEIDSVEATQEFRRLFDQAIACRIGDAGTVACELSGGLDSTSVAVSAAPMLADKQRTLHSFSHVLPEGCEDALPVQDERDEIGAILAALSNVEPRWLTGGGARQSDCLVKTIDLHGGLQRRDLNAIGSELPTAVQKAGAKVLLSGFGGDQVATYEGAGYPESLAAQSRWNELAKSVPGGVFSARYLFWRTALGRTLLKTRALRRVSEAKSAMQRVTHRGIISDEDLLKRRLKYPNRLPIGTIEERERALITSPNVGHRLQDSAITAGAHGFDYAYPMLDIRLVEFCLTLPNRLKRTPTVRRRMIREAMVSRLPDKVRLREDKSGTTVPSFFLNHLADLDAYEELYRAHSADPLVADLVDMERVLEANEKARETHLFDGPISKRQLLRVAELCLWSRWLSEHTES